MRDFFDGDDEAVFDKFFRRLDVRFLLRVFYPCVATKFRRPSSLLREVVVNKDLGNLEELVKLDATLVSHPKLADILYPSDSAIRRMRWELIQAAVAKPPGGDKPRQVKYGIGGFMRWIAAKAGERLTVRSLFEMFNHAAVMQGNRDGDSDFEIDEETFRRGTDRFIDRLEAAL
jgi:hypothetical protein